MDMARPRKWWQALWPFLVGGPVGFFMGDLVPDHYWKSLAWATLMILILVVMRLMYLMQVARHIVYNMHELTAKLVEQQLPEARKIDLHMSDLTAEQLLKAIALTLRRLGTQYGSKPPEGSPDAKAQ